MMHTSNNIENAKNETKLAFGDLLDEGEVAKVLGVTLGALQRWRCRGGGPRFLKLNPGRNGRVRYRKEDLMAFIEGCLRASTSDPGPCGR